MKRLYFLYIFVLLPFCLYAQKDPKAKDILKKTENMIQKAESICIDFDMGEKGILCMKGDKFYLDCAGIQTWYNGKTQWSYVEANEEVNISTPTIEELQQINPYLLMKSYDNEYHYKYIGNRMTNGNQVYEIILFPQKKQDITSITLFISTEYIPLYIKVEQNNQAPVEFKVTNFQHSKHLTDDFFIFDRNKYPDAEMIDLR